MLTNSNLASAEEKLEYLLNCVHLGVSEGYDTLGVRSVLELGVQSTLLVKKCVEVNVRKEKQKIILTKFFLGANFCDADASNDL